MNCSFSDGQATETSFFRTPVRKGRRAGVIPLMSCAGKPFKLSTRAGKLSSLQHPRLTNAVVKETRLVIRIASHQRRCFAQYRTEKQIR